MTPHDPNRPARRMSAPAARNVVRRDLLLDRLDSAADSPVALVCAPAGYGKSLLVASWLEGSAVQDPVWVNVSSTHGGSGELWSAVVTGLATSLPDPDEELGAIGLLALGRPEEMAPRLGRWLNERDRETVLVLDDLHNAVDPDFHTGLVELVAATSDRLHLVAVTRHDPPWPLHRMRADGLLRDLRADSLAFDSAEAEKMFALLGLGVGPMVIAHLVARTQGWAAGLRLAAIGASTAPDPNRYLESISGRSDYIADYLTREVYDNLDRGWRDFLARIGAVDEISAELAEALGAGRDSGARLAELVHQNAFIQQFRDRPGWYRLHPLLLDFLRSRATDEHRRRALQSRAARWFRDQGEPSTAMRYALAAEDWELVDDLVGRHVVTWTVRRPPGELQRLLAPVPREQILDRPGLAIGFAGSLAMQGLQPGGVEEVVATARARLGEVSGRRRRRYQFLLEVIAVGNRRWLGDLPTVLDGYRQMPTDPSVLSDLGLSDWDAVRTLLIGNRGVCELWTGDLSAAHEDLSEAARVDGHRALALSTLNAQSHLAYLEMINGELNKAQELAEAAVAAFTELQVPGAVQARCAYLALAGVAIDRYELEVARRWLQIARQGADEPHSAFATELLSARLLEAEGKPFDAIAAVQGARHRAADLLIVPQLIEQSRRLEARLTGRVADISPMHGLDVGVEARTTGMPPGPSLRARVDRHLSRAEHALITGSRRRALDELEAALILAAPEQLRRPFLTSRNLGQLLSARSHLGTRDPAFVADLASRAAGQVRTSPSAAKMLVPLTERESNVLRYLATTLPAKEIAATLYVSINTVKTHQRSIYNKLGAGDRYEAVAHARSLGIL